MTDLSVIIGFKDWGSERIIGAVKTLLEATKNIDSEIIVSDYGSVEKFDAETELVALGAKYIYTETNGIWSRSRALNAGLQAASGSILATTDADMVFTQGTFDAIVETLRRDNSQYVLMQCRDLPEGIDHDSILSGNVSEQRLKQVSVFRPRWGMGGLIAFTRESYLALRGLDERMEIYGGEDIDLARRLRRLNLRQTWFQHPDAYMFHVWHPSSREAASETPEGKAAIALNSKIQKTDRSVARNIEHWEYRPPTAPPLVSVVISTYNRADYLKDCILSVLAQSFSDWELIIINDGSSDHTETVVKSFDDSRIKYFEHENRGLAASRNRGTALSSGRYIAVHDDDDVMLPDRLKNSLTAITEGINGTYGGWIDFIHETGDVKFNAGKQLSLESLLYNSSTYLHPTLFIEKRFLELVQYDETLRSGSDYNLAIRLQRAGAKLEHSGRYLIMRRLHDGQITATDSSIQKSSGAISALVGKSTMNWSDIKTVRLDRAIKDKAVVEGQASVQPNIIRFLPDSTVSRTCVIETNPFKTRKSSSDTILERGVGSTITELSTGSKASSLILTDVTLHELLLLISDSSLKVDVHVRSKNGRTNFGPLLPISNSVDKFQEERLISIFSENISFNSPGDQLLEIRSTRAEDINTFISKRIDPGSIANLAIERSGGPKEFVSIIRLTSELLSELIADGSLTRSKTNSLHVTLNYVEESA